MSINWNKTVSGIGNFFIGGFLGLVGVAIFLFSQIVSIIVCMIFGLDVDLFEGTYGFIAAVVGIVLTGLYILIRNKISKSSLVYLSKPSLDTVVSLFVIAFGLMGIVLVYFLIANFIAELLPSVSDELDKYSEVVDRYANVEATVIPAFDNWLNLIAVSILAPVVEEMVFRGVLLGELLKRINPVVSILFSATIFGLMHGISIHIGYALISGILIGYVYYVTHSIWSTIFLHATFNFWGSGLVTFLESGIFGDQTYLINSINSFTSYLFIVLIIPTFGCLVYLYTKFKAEKANEVEIEEEVIE